MKVLKSWVTGRPKGNYIASIALELEFGGGFRFQVRGMRLVLTADGRTTLAMPNIKGPQGNWHDLVVPCNQETRDVLEEAAIAAWSKSNPPGDLLEMSEDHIDR